MHRYIVDFETTARFFLTGEYEKARPSLKADFGPTSPIITAIPYWWRLQQCVRRFYDAKRWGCVRVDFSLPITLETTRFQTLNLKCDFLVSNVAFEWVSLCRYKAGIPRAQGTHDQRGEVLCVLALAISRLRRGLLSHHRLL
jgi:hypothetical protein